MLFATRKPALSPQDGSALLQLHPVHRFDRRDRLALPAGYEALLVSGGSFSRVFREGDEELLENGEHQAEGDLYFIRTQLFEPLLWGRGGILAGGRRLGLHGSLRLRIVSGRKLLIAFLAEPLPLSEEHLHERLREELLFSVTTAVQQLAQTGPLPGRETEAAAAACELLGEALERYGLSIEALQIDEFFFPDNGEEAP